MNYLQITLPNWFGNPTRHYIETKTDLIKFFKTNNGIAPLFYSVYGIDNTIDRIFFDFDGEESFMEVKKLAEYLHNNNIKHIVLFSGRGFHIYIIVKKYIPKNKKATILNFQQYIISEVKLSKVDKAVIGDISRLARIPNSINQKSGLYCIYLSLTEVLNLNFEDIKKLALRPRNYFDSGEELIDLSKFDIDTPIQNGKHNNLYNTLEPKTFNITRLNEEEFNNIVNILPPCIKNFVNEYDGASSFYKKRFDMILFLRDFGLDLEMITKFLYTLMTEKKFKKVMREERIDRVYEKEYASPACNTLKIDFKCVYCDLYPNPVKKKLETLF